MEGPSQRKCPWQQGKCATNQMFLLLFSIHAGGFLTWPHPQGHFHKKKKEEESSSYFQLVYVGFFCNRQTSNWKSRLSVSQVFFSHLE